MKHIHIFFFLGAIGAAAVACGGSSNNGQGGGGSGTSTLHSGSHGSTGGGVVACNPGDMHDCYTGPGDTRDVGNCKAGVQICDDSGNYGPCMNQVQPHEENCNKRGDEDCDGNACSDAVWDKVAGDAGSQLVSAVEMDQDGNLYAVGAFTGSMDLGKGPVAATGAGDLFLAKFDPTGQLVWENDFTVAGGALDATITSIALSSNGDVAIAGTISAVAVTFGTTVVTGPAHDIGFAGLFGDDGTQKWVKPINGAGKIAANTVAFEVTGPVVVGGGFTGALTCQTGPCPSSNKTSTAFLRAYDNMGKDTWTQAYGTSNNDRITSLVVTDAGNLLAAGLFVTTTNLNGQAFTSNGGDDIFVLQTNKLGNPSRATGFGSTGDDFGLIAARPDGSFIVGGFAAGEIMKGGVTTGAGTNGAFVFSFDDHLQPVWATKFGTDGQSRVEGLAVDGRGYALIAGQVTNGKADFGGGVINDTEVAPDAALTKMDGNGNVYWSKKFQGPGNQGAVRVAVNSNGYIAFSMGYQNQVDFGLGLHTSTNTDGDGNNDIALVAFQP